MPGFVTHYIFGKETCHHITNITLQENISQHQAVYNLGLQGPDLFFYYLPCYVLHIQNLGSLAHKQRTGKFFQELVKSCQRISNRQEHAIATAYVAGFLGHYTLDTICHPYIYAMTHYNRNDKAYFSRHAYLETDIDTALLDEHLHKKPSAFHAWDTLDLSYREKKVVSQLLYDAYHRTYPQLIITPFTMRTGIFSLQFGMHLLHDNSGQKKVLVRFTEKHFLGYPVFSPLIPSDELIFRTDPMNLRHATWKNPWDASLQSDESFPELYQKAMVLYLKRLKKLAALNAKPNDSAEYTIALNNLLADYGDLSFHSGLDWEKTEDP
jgi:hypothetical protein